MRQEGDVIELEDDDEYRDAEHAASDAALLREHLHENSLPFYLFDVLFRPRLAVVRWARSPDERLRDRATGIMAVLWGSMCLDAYLLAGFPQSWPRRIETIVFFVIMFFVLNLMLALSARLFDSVGRRLGADRNFDRLRMVLAMSFIPRLAFGIPMSLVRLSLAGLTFSESGTENLEIIRGGLGLMSMIWSAVFTVFAVKAVQHFSFWRALGNSVLGGLYVIILTALLSGGLYLAAKGHLPIFNFGPMNPF